MTVADTIEKAVRFAEANGLTRIEVAKLVDVVFDKINQERSDAHWEAVRRSERTTPSGA